MADVQEQLDYLLAVDRLISAAEEARRKRDRLLGVNQSPSKDAAPIDRQQAKGQGGKA